MRYLPITIIPCFATICNHQDVEKGKKKVPEEKNSGYIIFIPQQKIVSEEG